VAQRGTNQRASENICSFPFNLIFLSVIPSVGAVKCRRELPTPKYEFPLRPENLVVACTKTHVKLRFIKLFLSIIANFLNEYNRKQKSKQQLHLGSMRTSIFFYS